MENIFFSRSAKDYPVWKNRNEIAQTTFQFEKVIDIRVVIDISAERRQYVLRIYSTWSISMV